MRSGRDPRAATAVHRASIRGWFYHRRRAMLDSPEPAGRETRDETPG
jgi:hypothetical protein